MLKPLCNAVAPTAVKIKLSVFNMKYQLSYVRYYNVIKVSLVCLVNWLGFVLFFSRSSRSAVDCFTNVNQYFCLIK